MRKAARPGSDALLRKSATAAGARPKTKRGVVKARKARSATRYGCVGLLIWGKSRAGIAGVGLRQVDLARMAVRLGCPDAIPYLFEGGFFGWGWLESFWVGEFLGGGGGKGVLLFAFDFF